MPLESPGRLPGRGDTRLKDKGHVVPTGQSQWEQRVGCCRPQCGRDCGRSRSDLGNSCLHFPI